MKHGGALNVAIVGGGPGCKAILDMIFAEKLSQLRMKPIGVACTNPEAVGYRYAQEKGIYTTKDHRDLYSLEGLNMIIELTGRTEVADDISRTKPDHVRLMDHVTARLFWDVCRIQEKRIKERERAERQLRKHRDRLEALVKDRTADLAVAHEQLQHEIPERKRAEAQREKLIAELQEALAKVKTLSGLLPICASCKKVRDESGYWNHIERYVSEHSEAQFTHSICPECARAFYRDLHPLEQRRRSTTWNASSASR